MRYPTITPLPYQEEGAQWLVATARAFNGRAYLGDAPGLGKTVTAIRAMQLAGINRPLILCPAIVRPHWERSLEAMGYPAQHATVRSYSKIAQLAGSAALVHAARDHDALICDEAHELRSPVAKKTQVVLGRLGLMAQVPWTFFLSGTPMWKEPMNLWTVWSAAFGSHLAAWGIRNRGDWLHTFCHYVVRYYGIRGTPTTKVVGVRNPERLQQLLAPVLLRRRYEDVETQLPQVFWQTQALELPQVLAEVAVAAVVLGRVAAGESLGDVGRDMPLASLRHTVGMLKAEVVATQLLEELEGHEEKVVVMAYHHDVLDVLERVLRPHGVVRIDGGTSPAFRTARIDRFQQDPATRVFLGQNGACMTGITLTAAHRLELVEMEWSAKANVQLAHRVARIGQGASHCLVRCWILAQSVDEAVLHQHHRELVMESHLCAPAGVSVEGAAAGLAPLTAGSGSVTGSTDAWPVTAPALGSSSANDAATGPSPSSSVPGGAHGRTAPPFA